MDFILPLKDVTVHQKDAVQLLKGHIKTGDNWQVNRNEFYLEVRDIGNFYVRNGDHIEFSLLPGADQDWIKLYLNGQVLVALLHQRKVITFHSSSFIYKERGVMILGESGAGKSSLTASFVLKGAGLLTDDVSPVIFKGSVPYVWPLHGEIRIRRNTAIQLNVNKETLREAEAGTDKQYLSVGSAGVEDFPLHTILKIEVGNVGKPEFDEPLPVEKFAILRSEICMWEIIAGMPETEAEYLHQLVEIVKQVKIIRVVRPAEIKITDLHAAMSGFLTTM